MKRPKVYIPLWSLWLVGNAGQVGKYRVVDVKKGTGDGCKVRMDEVAPRFAVQVGIIDLQ